MKLNEKILLLRKKAGLSQEELAFKLNVSRQAVYKWESENAVPEVDKIKALAKLFNVSFDYLMDDSVDEISSQKEIKKTVAPRKPFYTQVKTSTEQASVDHGYTQNRKAKQKEDCFSLRCSTAKKAVAEVGGVDVLRLNPESSTTYFYDSNNKVFGFYYCGAVQFVCPIENILSFQFGGGEQTLTNSKSTVLGLGLGRKGINSFGVGRMPTVNAHNSSFAWATLSYRDGDVIKELKLSFSTLGTHLAFDCKNIEEMEMWEQMSMKGLLSNLQKLQAKLEALKQEGQRILNGEIQAPPVKVEFYTEKNKKFRSEYAVYMNYIEESAKKANKIHLIKNICFWGVLIGFGVLLVVLVGPEVVKMLKS